MKHNGWHIIAIAAFWAMVPLLSSVRYDQVFQVLNRIPLVACLVRYNFPPKDYYISLAETSLGEKTVDLKFRCKYRGRHEIRIEGEINDERLWKSNIGMNIDIRRSDGRVVYKRSSSNTYILGGGEKGHNYCYAIFDSPNDVPLGEELTAHISCYGDIERFLSIFPEAKIVVTKEIDK